MNHATRPCPRMLTYKPPRIAFTLLTAAGVLQLAAPAAWAWPRLPSSPLGGTVLGVLGFLVMLRAWWLFRVYKTAICPTAPTTTLLMSDIYGLTRNPMYLGIVLMLLGTAMGTGGLFLYLATLTFFLIINFVFCAYEEQKLELVFGDEFDRYCRTVRRWL